MSLHETIKNQIKEAMKAKDEVRLMTLRGLSSTMTNEAVSLGRTPQDMLSDEEAMTVISRTAKQRKDAIGQFRTGGREDLALEDEAQLKILEEFLPAQMEYGEIVKLAVAKKAELGIDATKKNMLIGILAKDLKGRADGAIIKEVVESLFT
jgi:uncharacterized protein YqeY